VRVLLTHAGETLIDDELEVGPGYPFTQVIEGPSGKPHEYRISVMDSEGSELIAFQPEIPVERKLPEPASEPLQPEQIETTEELYLTGLHLEQYRHATRSPESYWREGLKRDPENAQLNNAMGLINLRKGQLAEAEEHFAFAVRRLTRKNPNPTDGEPFYNLGMARMYLGKSSAAYDALHKSVWNYAWQSAGYYSMASINSAHGNYTLALKQVERSLLTNINNLKARALKASLLRKTGRGEEARAVVSEALAIDRLDFRMMAERFLASRHEQDLDEYLNALEGDAQTLLDVSYDLAWAGLGDDAYALLKGCSQDARYRHPMLLYTISWIASSLGLELESLHYAEQGEGADSTCCFPARVEEMIVLEDVLKRVPSSPKAHYYLGNLYYDKRRYEEAIACWRRSVELDAGFSVPWRNLGIAEFNVLHDPLEADRMYQQAFAANPADARVLYEWDQLTKRAGLVAPEERLRSLESHRELVASRDDLTVEYVTLLNQCGRCEEALELLASRRFSPWEGGEGLVSAQYVHAHRSLGKTALVDGRFVEALRHFEEARHYPENLGEGKHLLTQERDLDYLSGLAAEGLGDIAVARRFGNAASAPLDGQSVQSYFRGKAMLALGEEQAAHNVFSSLGEFAAIKMRTEPKIDYFATSLPNLLLFDDDIHKRNRIDSQLLSALAHEGLGYREQAKLELEDVVGEDRNHLFAAEMLSWIQNQRKLVAERIEERQ
jgi:tetratricopeptide (TPR) repeat protein